MKKFARGMKNSIKGYNEAQVLIRDCTSNDEGPPDPRLLRQVATYTLDSNEKYDQIWKLLWDRCKHFQYIRHVARGLLTIEYLLVHGNERIIHDMTGQLMTIRRLTTYKYYKDGNKDIAGDVRNQAVKVLQLMEDKESLKQQRETAAANRKKFVGGNMTGFGSDSKNAAPKQQAPGKGEIRTVHKWQDETASKQLEPGAAEPAKKKKKKKKKKKDKNISEHNDTADFDEFPDIDFQDAPPAAEPVQIEALAPPPTATKSKKRQAAAAAPTGGEASPFSFGDEPIQQPPKQAPNSGEDWISSLSQPTTTASNNLFDDMFNQVPAQQTDQQMNNIFFDTPSKPAEPVASPTPEANPQTDPFYDQVVNTDDIFGTQPVKRQPKSGGQKRTMSQLQQEQKATQMMQNMNMSAAPSQAQQPNIFAQMNPQQNPFGQPQLQPAANPFGAAPEQPAWGQPQQPVWGQPQQAQQQPAWGAQQQPTGWGQPQQQQQQQPTGWGQPQPTANTLYQAPQQGQQKNPFEQLDVKWQ